MRKYSRREQDQYLYEKERLEGIIKQYEDINARRGLSEWENTSLQIAREQLKELKEEMK
jgi:hypothetical protein